MQVLGPSKREGAGVVPLTPPCSKLAGGGQSVTWAHKHQGHTLGVAEQKMGSSLNPRQPQGSIAVLHSL